ncbi:MAG: hypothetical protein JXA08_00535 [Methanomicrobiaceae archaeon]|nr:hypothetical protein [Methanomicrobiaceae archaeon]
MGPRLKLLGKILLALVIIMAILAAAFVVFIGYQLNEAANESRQSIYMYELTLSATGPIDNASLLIPLPCLYDPVSGTNETVVNLSRVSFTNVDRAGPIAAEIQTVGGVPLLHLSADRIDPIYKNHIEPIMIRPGQNESELPQPTHIYSDRYSNETPELVAMELHLHDTSVGREIDTRIPLGNAAVFLPCRIVSDLSSVEGGMYEDYYIRNGSSGNVVEVPFILSYDADDETVLSIRTQVVGINQWWVLGWQSNSYTETLSHAFTGPCNGTYPVTGVLTAGEGVY